MKLIDDYVERFHSNALPSPEKCFIIEDGDEVYINKWIHKGKISGNVKDMFEWIEKKYLSNKSQLKKTDIKKFNDIYKRFYIKNWRIILLLSDYQKKYRYYKNAIKSIKSKSYSNMSSIEFLSTTMKFLFFVRRLLIFTATYLPK